MSSVSSNQTKGILLSLLAIPVGVAAWVLLWQYGFIASFVAFGIAFAAVWLYQVGSGEPVHKSMAWKLLLVILLAVVLSFLGGMMSDAWVAYGSEEIGGTQSFFSGDFWDFFIANILTVELWSQYAVDLLIAVAFAVLGAGGIVKDLFTPTQPAGKPAKS